MISYETNIITIEGAELLRKSKEQNKKVEIHKAAFLPLPISRDVAASLKYTNFVGSEWTQYLPELDNIEFVSGQGSNLEICTKAASEDNLFVKSIVLFAKLYNEDSDDVALAVISDDNSVVELSETNIKVQLNASAKDFYLFGKDDDAELIENIEKYTINDEGEAVSGLQFTLSKDGEDDITIGRDKVVLSCELIDGALVFTTGNGDLFSISGENVTIEKSTLYPLPPTPTPTTKRAYINSWKGNGSFSYDDGAINNVYNEAGEALEYDDTKAYTVKGAYLADGTSVSYTSMELTDQQNTMMGLSWTGLSQRLLCYVEYTEE